MSAPLRARRLAPSLRSGALAAIAMAVASASPAWGAGAAKKAVAAEVRHDPADHHLKVDIAPIGDAAGPWRLRVENVGPAPVRLIADARLVSLDVEATAKEEADAAAAKPKSTRGGKAAAAKKAPHALVAHCKLPAEMRPPDEDDARALLIPPGRAFAETFDVRAMCFGAELDALVPGAKVTAHFGWPESKSRKAAGNGPFVLGPPDLASTGAAPVESVSELTLPTRVLGGLTSSAVLPVTTTPLPPTVAPPADTDDDSDSIPSAPMPLPETRHHSLTLSLPRYVDHESRVDIPAPLTVTNEGARPRAIFYRASRVKFDVVSPVGERSTCGLPPDQTPLREFYTHLGKGQSAHLSMLVSDVCDVDTFSRAGVYEVVAHVDDTGLSGAYVGMSAFSGVLTSKPMLVRVRRASRHVESPRPHLE